MLIIDSDMNSKVTNLGTVLTLRGFSLVIPNHAYMQWISTS